MVAVFALLAHAVVGDLVRGGIECRLVVQNRTVRVHKPIGILVFLKNVSDNDLWIAPSGGGRFELTSGGKPSNALDLMASGGGMIPPRPADLIRLPHGTFIGFEYPKLGIGKAGTYKLAIIEWREYPVGTAKSIPVWAGAVRSKPVTIVVK